MFLSLICVKCINYLENFMFWLLVSVWNRYCYQVWECPHCVRGVRLWYISGCNRPVCVDVYRPGGQLFARNRSQCCHGGSWWLQPSPGTVGWVKFGDQRWYIFSQNPMQEIVCKKGCLSWKWWLFKELWILKRSNFY